MHISASAVSRRRCRAVCLLTLLALLVVPAVAQDTNEEGGRHMLWEVSSEAGVEGYLVGSIHVMKPEAYPLDDVYDEAFAASKVLAFEADQDSMTAQARSLTMRLALYPEGKTLKSELSSDTYQQLKARAEKLGLPFARMQRLEPWMMSMTIPVVQMQKAGYTPGAGIDAHFFKKAKAAGKERLACETTAEQLGFFDDMPAERQEAFLRYSLEEAERNMQLMEEMMGYWKSGDAQALEEVMQDEMQQEFPDLYETLITERNQNWMPQIMEMLEGEARPMIVVGVGHVVGEDGLVALLEARGYTVEQL